MSDYMVSMENRAEPWRETRFHEDAESKSEAMDFAEAHHPEWVARGAKRVKVASRPMDFAVEMDHSCGRTDPVAVSTYSATGALHLAEKEHPECRAITAIEVVPEVGPRARPINCRCSVKPIFGPADHFAEAEKALTAARENWTNGDKEDAMAAIAEAQVHATLALVRHAPLSAVTFGDVMQNSRPW